jgi:hypothetical protein
MALPEREDCFDGCPASDAEPVPGSTTRRMQWGRRCPAHWSCVGASKLSLRESRYWLVDLDWRRGGWYSRDSIVGRSRQEKPSGHNAAAYDWACVIFLRPGRRTPKGGQRPAALLLATRTAQLSDKA